MAEQKVILYYCFTPISDPTAMRFWQQTLCETLGLKGRIIISKQGINGTLGGDMDDLKNMSIKQSSILVSRRRNSNGLVELAMTFHDFKYACVMS